MPSLRRGFYLGSHSHELHCRIKVNVAGLKCFSAQQSGSNSKLVLSESKKKFKKGKSRVDMYSVLHLMAGVGLDKFCWQNFEQE